MTSNEAPAVWGKCHYPATVITALCGREMRSSNLAAFREAFAASDVKCAACVRRLEGSGR